MIISGKAVAGVWRYAKAGDFRSNLHQGGRADAANLSREMSELAEEAAQAIGLACGAIDIIETDQGMAVLEINGCPGFRSIESTLEVDVASAWIEAAIHG